MTTRLRSIALWGCLLSLCVHASFSNMGNLANLGKQDPEKDPDTPFDTPKFSLSFAGLFDKFTFPAEDQGEYDYIIVGGGGAGCIVAQTLAENGFKTLVLERGGTREEFAPAPTSKRFVGIERSFAEINENVITRQGIRSNIGRVLSGGTAINQGIIIAEEVNGDYFDFLETEFGTVFDRTLLQEAYDYVQAGMSESPALDSQTSNGGQFPMPLDKLGEGFDAIGGFENGGFTHRFTVEENSWWRTFSAFNLSINEFPKKEQGFRQASDFFINFEEPNLTIKTKSTVLKVEFDTSGETPEAKCVVWKDSPELDEVDKLFEFSQDPFRPPAERAIDEITRQKLASWIYLLDQKGIIPDTTIGAGPLPDATWPVDMMPDMMNPMGEEEDDKDGTKQKNAITDFAKFVGMTNIPTFERIDFPGSLGVGETRFLPTIEQLAKSNQGRDFLRRLSTTVGDKLKSRYKACLSNAPHAKVIMSAGAVYTPAILYKSGVGPEDLIKQYGYDLVADSPYLGKNLHDRPLLPISMFMREEFRDKVNANEFLVSKFPILRPTSSEVAGFSSKGSDCSAFSGMGYEGEDCAYVAIEENSFGHLTAGVLFQSRFYLPISLRNTHAADLLQSFVRTCSPTSDEARSRKLCDTVNWGLLLSCIERGVGWAFFVPVPYSRGTIELNESGDVKVNPNYYEDPRDRRSAIEGIRTLANLIFNAEKDPEFLATMETVADLRERPKEACPYGLFNGLLGGVREFSRVLALQADGNVRVDLDNINEVVKSYFEDPEQLSPNAKPTNKGRSDNAAERLTLFPELPSDEILFDDDEKTLNFVASYATSIWHFAGTARMGGDNDIEAVVNNNFSFKGVDKLAVVDASLLAQLTRMNPAINVQAIARYAGLVLVDEATP
uniref:Glucose-methanol-choline oxidoreductase N-terminal domain-containing protein n=1 Tax=Chromera velia CCMP2878 TaxID=1169474 RepID=A0A0G4H8F0_9ALVE|eukprot:Cvel_5887.t1-p1 / transcript=Cvel_5887.t1 / gene=Cvel_5887 / organism=Chromera_velia_CCMP2878 / gene_product=(R)-mandelonitrile lyase 1, putative / transcript_product=(R)-mandelonitrile lyase 1, putative / location=Cvel_scaffold280:70903-81558(+) / protein_length=893 / sequence_SO=supercontig / SO=protein_coding / is_pseudo=false